MSRGALMRLGLLALIWGSSFLLIVYALEGVAPPQLVLARLVTGAVVLLGIVAARRVRMPREPALWLHLVAMGIVGNIVPYWLYGFSGERISSGLNAILNGTTPLFTLLVAVGAARVGWSRERLTRDRVAGLIIGFLGTVLVVAPWMPGALSGSLSGQAAALIAAACYGIAFIYTQRFISPSGYAPLALAAAQLTCAAVVLAIAAPVVARTPVELSPRVVASLLLLGATHTGVAYHLYYRLIAEAGATSASMVTYLLPVVAVILGIVLLDEPLRWNAAVGAMVVLAGVALAEGRLRRHSSAEAPPERLPVGGRR